MKLRHWIGALCVALIGGVVTFTGDSSDNHAHANHVQEPTVPIDSVRLVAFKYPAGSGPQMGRLATWDEATGTFTTEDTASGCNGDVDWGSGGLRIWTFVGAASAPSEHYSARIEWGRAKNGTQLITHHRVSWEHTNAPPHAPVVVDPSRNIFGWLDHETNIGTSRLGLSGDWMFVRYQLRGLESGRQFGLTCIVKIP